MPLKITTTLWFDHLWPQEQEAAKREEELAEANKDDEKTIKRLEKELNFKKNRKTKAKITPSIFKADGLDCILEIFTLNNLSVIIIWIVLILCSVNHVWIKAVTGWLSGICLCLSPWFKLGPLHCLWIGFSSPCLTLWVFPIGDFIPRLKLKFVHCLLNKEFVWCLWCFVDYIIKWSANERWKIG